MQKLVTVGLSVAILLFPSAWAHALEPAGAADAAVAPALPAPEPPAGPGAPEAGPLDEFVSCEALDADCSIALRGHGAAPFVGGGWFGGGGPPYGPKNTCVTSLQVFGGTSLASQSCQIPCKSNAFGRLRARWDNGMGEITTRWSGCVTQAPAPVTASASNPENRGAGFYHTKDTGVGTCTVSATGTARGFGDCWV